MNRPKRLSLLIGHDLLIFGLANALRSRGERVIVRDSSEQTIAGLDDQPPPDLILLDLLVARRHDFALVRSLRATETLATVPIIVLASGTLGPEREQLEDQLCALGVRPMLDPHELEDLLSVMACSLDSVA